MKKLILVSLIITGCGGSVLPGERGNFGAGGNGENATLQDGDAPLCSITVLGTHVVSESYAALQIQFLNATPPFSITGGDSNLVARTHTFFRKFTLDGTTNELVSDSVSFTAANGVGACEFSILVTPK